MDIMFYLYIIKSVLVKRHYIGITHDIDARIKKHNTGSVRSTKAYRPWALVYEEVYKNKTDARKEEIRLKRNAKARTELFESFK